MIDRYNCEEISSLWTDEKKFTYFLQVELALLKALEKQKMIPAGVSQYIKENSKIDVDRIIEIEKTTHHDVIAFCTSITENLDESKGRYFHYGVTSSDIIDTALSLQLRESTETLVKEVDLLLEELKEIVKRTKDIITLGRSHGMFAEPMSFAQKFLSSYAEIERCRKDLQVFLDEHLTCQISGTIGNYSIVNFEVEKDVAKELNLSIEPVSSQVIPRDRVARLFQINALLATAYERLAVEIRHLHHSDLAEVHEGFAKGQKGSSAMPHKKNPVSCENISGLSRVIRGHLTVALENIPLWHERDISHSSAERISLPDNLGLMFYMTRRMKNTIKNLVVHKEVIEEKVFSKFAYLSTYVLHQLIDKLPASREKMYEIVQGASFHAKDRNEFCEIINQKVSELGLEASIDLKIDEGEIRRIYTSYFQDKMKQFNI